MAHLLKKLKFLGRSMTGVKAFNLIKVVAITLDTNYNHLHSTCDWVLDSTAITSSNNFCRETRYFYSPGSFYPVSSGIIPAFIIAILFDSFSKQMLGRSYYFKKMSLLGTIYFQWVFIAKTEHQVLKFFLWTV